MMKSLIYFKRTILTILSSYQCNIYNHLVLFVEKLDYNLIQYCTLKYYTIIYTVFFYHSSNEFQLRTFQTI